MVFLEAVLAKVYQPSRTPAELGLHLVVLIGRAGQGPAPGGQQSMRHACDYVGLCGRPTMHGSVGRGRRGGKNGPGSGQRLPQYSDVRKDALSAPEGEIARARRMRCATPVAQIVWPLPVDESGALSVLRGLAGRRLRHHDASGSLTQHAKGADGAEGAGTEQRLTLPRSKKTSSLAESTVFKIIELVLPQPHGKTKIGRLIMQHVVEIRYVKIDGLYSYGSEKNRIDFGKKTVVVGASDSGKSSIFKALRFFLKCLTEYDSDNLGPWGQQNTHEMTVGLSLNDEERLYTAEILSVIGEGEGHHVDLAPDEIVEWLAPKLGQVNLTIRWYDRSFQPGSGQIFYSLSLENLKVLVHSYGYNQDAWAGLHPSRSAPRRERQATPLPDVIEIMLKEDLATKDLGAMLVRAARICEFPTIARLDDINETVHYRNRVKLVVEMSTYRTRHDPCHFFVMFGRMLERGFVFVSEQRRFQKSNDLKRLPLKSDGSNLQSYLFWLQNGDMVERDAFYVVQRMFEEVVQGQPRMSFAVSATERRVSDKKSQASQREICLDEAVVRFAKRPGRKQNLLDFMSVGTGIRETLFLLTMCFGRQDGVVLLDEPAAGLPPTQISQLMDKIISTGESAKSRQVAYITNSPSLASLDLLSRANEIVRVSRREYSLVAQPDGKDKEWLEKNLLTFHHLKSDVFFAGGVVLVEGYSDKFFLEAILDQGSVLGGDIMVVDVGGKKSFEKFRRLLGIFEIPHVVLADGDAKCLFDVDEMLEIDTKTVPEVEDETYKTVCILEKNLEGFLSDLEPELYAELEKKHKPKPERAYRFAERFFAGERSDKNAKILEFLTGWISKNLESAGQYGDPAPNPKSLPAGSADGA